MRTSGLKFVGSKPSIKYLDALTNSANAGRTTA